MRQVRACLIKVIIPLTKGLMMYNSIKQTWIKALKSGDYFQDKGRLKKESGYCLNT